MQTAINEWMAAPNNETLRALTERSAFYAYAIARPKAGEGLAHEPITGVDPRYRVRAVGHGDLVALVSDVSLAEYDLDQLRVRLQDAAWLELLAISHQKVMSALLDHFTLLPLKLCTLYTDEANIHAALEADGPWFRATLDQVEGAREWGVKAFCDQKALCTYAQRHVPQLRALVDSLEAASAGARYMLDKRLQRASQQAADDLRQRELGEIKRRLASVARAVQLSSPQSAQIHGHKDDMVLNGAYLVGEMELESFLAALDELSEEYQGHGFSFVLTGPWPAYSFSTRLEGGD